MAHHPLYLGISELWSAYAPNFKEIDENDEYTEKEDEFDIVSGRGLTGGRLSGALAINSHSYHFLTKKFHKNTLM